ncbi:aspartate aminotransferase family protein [Roseospira visakhapatnamensis]|uniref:Putrescine aminotransferase n=1 Tax=Roseospira visakhapatnamensis TaxID=390880 RepID=A0A7W6RDB0_9PROT|nr:aspartate aminotransferase family protein [Roseospira visakhapatnamensis]MBB4266393.1 putrescine aminotransferase [Roseospira visakhapatnamensis]
MTATPPIPDHDRPLPDAASRTCWESGAQSSADWRALDAAHNLHPFSDHKALATEGSRVITRAEGVWLWDSDGTRVLDGMAGLWCVNVGYGRPELVQTAARQMTELPYYNLFFKTATPPAIELSRKLVELTPPGLNHVFLVNSGSEANDTIIRMVRHFWALEGQPERRVIIARDNGYHGSTLAVASMSGMTAMHKQGGLPLPDFAHIREPHRFKVAPNTPPEAFAHEAAGWLEEAILSIGPGRVAAFIGEPIQGAGGLIVPPPGYWAEIQRICTKYDVLLIADEVICGFGRTGQWFGSDTYRIRPDMMTLAKGLSSGYMPVAAAMVGDRVAATLIDRGGEFLHGFTSSGHPTACAVALENISILEREGLVDRVREDIGPYLMSRLETLRDHPLVGEVRGQGLLAGVELIRDKAHHTFFSPVGRVGARCRDHCFRNNAVVRAVYDTMVMAPPLVIGRDEIDILVDTLSHALDQTHQDLPRLLD